MRVLIFRERVCNFSLRSRTIGPSDFFGPRRKVVLRGEDYAWAPVLGSFDKLREVGVLFYLFYPLFKCFVMLRLVEALNGRLIGTEVLEFMEPIWAVRDSSRTIWAC